jgi:hypothetical protein
MEEFSMRNGKLYPPWGKEPTPRAKPMRDNQSAAGVVDEVLERCAKARTVRTGESFEESFENAPGAILDTEAGQQPREPGSCPHLRERAGELQANVAQERAYALGQSSTLEASKLSMDG